MKHPENDPNHFVNTGACICLKDCCNIPGGTDKLCACPDENRDACFCDHAPTPPKESNVSEIKPGDMVTYKVGSKPHTVLAVDGNILWVKQGSGYPFTTLDEGWEKVVPFFEKGVTYRQFGQTFTCHDVQRNRDGCRVAYGFVKTDMDDYWTVKHEYDYGWWARK